jgi:hypothetical protein
VNKPVSHQRVRWDFSEPFAHRFRELFLEWCPWPESNQHSLRNSILSRARLPVPPQGPLDTRRQANRRKVAGI